MMEWNSQDGIAKLLVGFEKNYTDLFVRITFIYFAKSFLKICWGSFRVQLKKWYFPRLSYSQELNIAWSMGIET